MPLGYNYHTLIILYSPPSLNSGLFWSPAVLFMLPRNLSENRSSNPGNDVTESTRVEDSVLGRQVNSTDPLLEPPISAGVPASALVQEYCPHPFPWVTGGNSILSATTLYFQVWSPPFSYLTITMTLGWGASWEENSTMFIVNIMIQRWPLV